MLYSLSSLLYIPTLLPMTTRFRLADLLAARSMTQSELARRSGVTFQTVNAICGNRTKGVSLETLDALAAVLQVEPGALIESTAKPHRKRAGGDGS